MAREEKSASFEKVENGFIVSLTTVKKVENGPDDYDTKRYIETSAIEVEKRIGEFMKGINES